MTRSIACAVALACLAGGCFRPQGGLQGQCGSDASCPAGSRCDTGQSPAICVVPQGSCFPACRSGYSCVSGTCTPAICAPPCNSGQSCDPATVTCKEVSAATVAITSPAASSYVGPRFTAQATARAPGGASGVTFQLLATSGPVLGSFPATANGPGSPDFAAQVVLPSTATEGPLNMVATLSYPTSKTLDTAPLPIQVDLTPPSISVAAYNPGATWLGPAHPTATVTATVTDSGSGVDPSTVKLTLLGGSAKSYAGTPIAGGLYTFSVPLADLGVPAGTTQSVFFKLDATDLAGNASPSLAGASQYIQVDLTKPIVTISADQTWYARSAGIITVTASVSDADSRLVSTGSNAPFLSIGSAPAVYGVPITGTADWTFALDLKASPAGTEGPFAFTIFAQDLAGNVQSTIGTRNVDDKAPRFEALRVYVEGTAAVRDGVTYPMAFAANGYTTGYDGNHFLYSDNIHIKGTLSDNGAGLTSSSLFFRIDGADDTGGAILAPARQALVGPGCSTDGASSCSFDLPAGRLGDLAKNGHLRNGAGTMSLTLLAQDRALASDRSTALPNQTQSSTPLNTTRLYWSRQFTGAPAPSVSGIGIYPNGDIIVTLSSVTPTPTVYAIFPDGPFNSSGLPQRWAVGTGFYGTSDLGSVDGAPAIGDGAAGTAKIYVATASGDLSAIAGTGTPVWYCNKGSLGNFHGSPSVTGLAKLGGISGCEAVSAVGDDGLLYAACQLGGATCTNRTVNVGAPASASSPSYIGGQFYVGTGKSIARTALSANGTFSNSVLFPGPDAGPFSGVAGTTSGLFAGNSSGALSPKAYGFTPNLSQMWSQTWGSILSPPALGPSGVAFVTTDARLRIVNSDSGITKSVTSLRAAGTTPLFASDSNIYLVLDGMVDVLADSASPNELWSYPIKRGTPVPPNVNCEGMLFVGAGDSLYTFITDMVGTPNSGGLKNTPWPKFQRDSRNSGSDTVTLWGVRTSNTVTGCVQ